MIVDKNWESVCVEVESTVDTKQNSTVAPGVIRKSWMCLDFELPMRGQ